MFIAQIMPFTKSQRKTGQLHNKTDGTVDLAMQLFFMNSAEQRLKKLNLAIERIRDKYCFTAIQTSRTIVLK